MRPDGHYAALEPAHISRMRPASEMAEEALLFAPPVADPSAELLRERAGEQAASLLSTLEALKRRLSGRGPAALETHAQYVARQAAPSGVTHHPKPNPRPVFKSRYASTLGGGCPASAT